MSHPDVVRVSTLEVFFDLVFVFTITQVTELILHAHDHGQWMLAALVLAVVWWMYGGYVWLTNNLSHQKVGYRVTLLLAMGAFLVAALALPQALGRDALAFGLAYLVICLLHLVLFTRAPGASAKAIFRVAPFNLLVSAFLIASAFVPAEWTWLPWAASLVVFALVPVVARVNEFSVHPAHFVERHGLVLMIVLGESVVSIGLGAAGLPVTPELVAVAVLSLLLTASLWWLYFDREDGQSEKALVDASPRVRGVMAVRGFSYAYFVMIAGIILIAAGTKLLISHFDDPAHQESAVALGVGALLYLVGDLGFRRALGLRASVARLVALVPVGLSIVLGVLVPGIAQMAFLLVCLVVVIVVEGLPRATNPAADH